MLSEFDLIKKFYHKTFARYNKVLQRRTNRFKTQVLTQSTISADAYQLERWRKHLRIWRNRL
jgi:hypothetical protein